MTAVKRKLHTDFAPEPEITAENCKSMADIRREIDRMDRALVALVTQRLTYIERAAEIKTARSAVRDEARIADVVAKVRAAAEARGAPPDLFEAVWRTLMAHSIAHEFARFDARTGSSD